MQFREKFGLFDALELLASANTAESLSHNVKYAGINKHCNLILIHPDAALMLKPN